jgi:hypothetical protein
MKFLSLFSLRRETKRVSAQPCEKSPCYDGSPVKLTLQPDLGPINSCQNFQTDSRNQQAKIKQRGARERKILLLMNTFFSIWEMGRT